MNRQIASQKVQVRKIRISLKVLNKLRKIAFVAGIRKHESIESYHKLIAPEITSGTLFELIQSITLRIDVVNILEIGSSSGEGSTKALIDALKNDPRANKNIHCLEVSKERFEKLSNYLAQDDRFSPHRLSSIKISDFPTFEAVEAFYKNTDTNLNKYHLDTIRAWYEKDISFLEINRELIPTSNKNTPISGIEWIKENYGIKSFDFVIIDGGEFTGQRELSYVEGSKYIALDDVNTFKCFEAFRELQDNPQYQLLAANLLERNGWAVFEKKPH